MTLRLGYLSADVVPLSAVARAALSGRPTPPSLPGTRVPGSIADVPEPEDRLDPDERAQLARALEARLSAFEPHVEVIESARALAAPGAACVVTGQQPGFLGGPLYNLYKALTAIRLARSLAAAWERPVVPVFWNHADDHDVAEVNGVTVVNANLDLRKVSLAGLSSGKRPLSDLVLRDDVHRIEPIGELLRQLLPATPWRDAAIERFLPRDGDTLPSAFTRAFLDLLGPLGLVVLEPAWLRGALSRALARVVALDPRDALAAGARALAAAGHEVPIDPATAALAFHHASGKRLALRAGGDGFRYDDEPGSRTPSELAAQIVERPAEWSAGALLRPLVQDAALPVAAYVGGFGELAYHAQLPPLRERAGLPQTPFVPRLAATLVDAETRASLERLGIGVADVVAGRALEADEDAPRAPVADDLRAVAARAAAELKALKEPLSELDRGLAVQLKKTAAQVVELVEKLAGKADRVRQNQEGKGRRHARRVESFLRPRGEPQERVLGVLEMTARHGTDWIEELLHEVDALPFEHLVVDLEGGPA